MLSPSEIRQIRDRAGLTQEDFGQVFGVAKTTVSLWESGSRRPTDYHQAAIRQFAKKVEEAERKEELDEFVQMLVRGAAAAGVIWLLTQLFQNGE
jgi:DNA-binding transcriptional regulator YiaG